MGRSKGIVNFKWLLFCCNEIILFDMITRKVLYDIVEDNTTRNGKYFDFFIQGLILLSLVSFSLETIPDISENIISFLYYLKFLLLVCFHWNI